MKCLICGGEMSKRNKKYCSYECYGKDKIGNVLPNSGQFKKGTTINLGRKRLDMIGNKLSQGIEPWNKGIRNGNQVRYDLIQTGEYRNLHYWVESKKGKPNNCENCGRTDDVLYQWANVSGKYLKELEDWMRLCIPCHRKYDKAMNINI